MHMSALNFLCLHFFDAEIFSIKIKQNQNIKSFKTDQMDKEVKNIQHADDMINII